jgi:hypothetical protein
MSKALRVSEKWFRRALWLIAFIFAGFLIGLGGLVVGDLPKVEQTLSVEDFIDKAGAEQARTAIKQARQRLKDGNDAMEQAQLLLRAAQSRSSNARETFANWVATRHATAQPAQDAELLARTRELDVLKAQERAAQAKVETVEQANLDTRRALQQSEQRLGALEQHAYRLLEQYQRQLELKVFLYRLALTLPLLALAGWLFVRKRNVTHWPFVWGFILFALFTFFVELVPYLPSYGGYVRYIVGIVLTALAGHYAIRSMKRYLERQKAVEQLPDEERRKDLSYDAAQARLAKGICPGCERAVDLKDSARNYCMHCGICLFDECSHCHTRKNAFARYCHACGAVARQ